jgi:hypothetical protein
MNRQFPLINLTLKNFNHIRINRFLHPPINTQTKTGAHLNLKPLCPTQEFPRVNTRLDDGKTKGKPQPVSHTLVLVIPLTVFGMMFVQKVLQMVGDEAEQFARRFGGLEFGGDNCFGLDHVECSIALEFDRAGADVCSAEVHGEKSSCFFACWDVGDCPPKMLAQADGTASWLKREDWGYVGGEGVVP